VKKSSTAAATTTAPAETTPKTKAVAKKAAKKTATSKAAAKTSSHPPRELHKVGDHWTAYNPPDPSTYPAGANTYAIKAGDTLWGIATQNFKNGYLWPQVWESNTWITDAHWIYPGDVLLIEGEAAQAAQQAATETTTTTPTLGSTTTTGTETGTTAGAATQQTTAGVLISAADAVGGTASPVAIGSDADVYCYGFIGDPNEPMPNSIHSYEDNETRYEAGAVRQEMGGSTGDLVYLNGGSSSGLVAGETYIVVEPGEMVTKPGSDQLVGRHYEYVGQVRVLCADDTRSRGIITQSCSDIHVGAKLRPLPQIPIPLARIPSLPAWCDPASGKTSGNIVHAQGGMWYFIPQFAGFLIFMTASFAETNRAPFDLVEADAELVGGYFTEYGGTPFVAYLFAEYMNMIVVSGMAVTLFLGGWLLPFGLHPPGWLDPIIVIAKIMALFTFFIWLRATLPRLRYDQLMSFGWKILLPLATLNLLVTAILVG